MADPKIVFYTTKFPATAKVRSDSNWIRYLLDVKNVLYEEVDLSIHPYRRVEMLSAKNSASYIPQLHVNGVNLGPMHKIQDHEDHGELTRILQGESPEKLETETANRIAAQLKDVTQNFFSEVPVIDHKATQ